MKRPLTYLRVSIALVLTALAIPSVVEATSDPGSDLSPDAQAVLEQKRSSLELEEAGRFAPAALSPSPATGPPEEEPPPKFHERLFGEEAAGGYPGYDFKNMWQQIIDGKYVTVYAGSRINSEGTGITGEAIVLLEVIDPDTWHHEWSTFELPIPPGPCLSRKSTVTYSRSPLPTAFQLFLTPMLRRS
jgi:hypothetical protein